MGVIASPPRRALLRRTTMRLGLLACVVLSSVLPAQQALSPDERFRAANALARAGDHPRALQAFRELAAEGHASASLYWNWAQVARARGAGGEALWALLSARELDPGARALPREIEALREALNLDPAEIEPDPLAALARANRRWRFDLLAVLLSIAALAAHALARHAGRRRAALVAWISGLAGALLAALALASASARPTAVVLTRGAPLLDSASPTATTLGSLREGEVVPLLDTSGSYVRLEDSSGARGWAHVEDVRPVRGSQARE
jgi:tetratricopeptide (TPR) repeat protein